MYFSGVCFVSIVDMIPNSSHSFTADVPLQQHSQSVRPVNFYTQFHFCQLTYESLLADVGV